MGHNDFVIAIAVFANAIGAVLLLIALLKYSNGKRFLAVAEHVTGTLIDVDTYEDVRPAPGLSMHGESKIDVDDRLVHYRTTMYRPIVRFTDKNGKSHTLKTGFSSSKFKEPGGTAVVVFPAGEPEKAKMLEFFWFWTRLIAVFGVVVLIIGLGTTLVLAVV